MSHRLSLFRVFLGGMGLLKDGLGIYGVKLPKRKPFKWPFNEVLEGYPYFHTFLRFGAILDPFKAILEGGKEKACEVVETLQARKGQNLPLFSENRLFGWVQYPPKGQQRQKNRGIQ